MIIPPADRPEDVVIRRGPNIKPIPRRGPLDEMVSGRVLTRVGDNISTDHILPAHASILSLRSNVPAIAEYVFHLVDPGFVARAKAEGGGFIVAGHNYGQGSSREHAALAPSYLGVKAVIAKSFARIHRANLTNFGVLPLTLADEAEYDRLDPGDSLEVPDARAVVQNGESDIPVINVSKNRRFVTRIELSDRLRSLLVAGGLLNSVRSDSVGADPEEGELVSTGAESRLRS
jgi:aconitate hydratase